MLMKMNTIKEYKEYAPIILRIGISLVFLWFGFSQVFNSKAWLVWLPQWTLNLPFEPSTFVLINGLFEVIFGILLILGLFTRVSALLLGLHLLPIMFSIGYNDIGVRDFGLIIATFAIFLYGQDNWSLDRIIKVWGD